VYEWLVVPGDDTSERFADWAKDGERVRLAPGVHRLTVPAKKCWLALRSGMTVTADPGASIEISGGGTLFCAVNRTGVRVEGVRATYVTGLPGNHANFLDVRGCLGVDVRGCDVFGFSSGVKSGRSAGTGTEGQLFDLMGEGHGPTRFLHVQNNRFSGMALAGVIFKSGGTQNAIIADNVFDGYGGYAASLEGEGTPQGLTSDVLFCDNSIVSGDTRWRGQTHGPIFGCYTGEHARNVRIVGNRFLGLGGDAATFAAFVGVSTSPGQGDTPVSDVTIEGNDFDLPALPKCRFAEIMLMPGNSSIRRVKIAGNRSSERGRGRVRVMGWRPDKTKSAGAVSLVSYPFEFVNEDNTIEVR